MLIRYMPACQAKTWMAAVPVMGWRTSVEKSRKGRQMYIATSTSDSVSIARRRPKIKPQPIRVKIGPMTSSRNPIGLGCYIGEIAFDGNGAHRCAVAVFDLER